MADFTNRDSLDAPEASASKQSANTSLFEDAYTRDTEVAAKLIDKFADMPLLTNPDSSSNRQIESFDVSTQDRNLSMAIMSRIAGLEREPRPTYDVSEVIPLNSNYMALAIDMSISI